MGDPDTLASFLQFGEENFTADHKVIIFWDHGGVSGICYDDSFNGDGLTYDELKNAFAAVYGNSPEEVPFELIGFKACVTGSYELANSLADFSHYMLGSEPSVWDWNFSDWIATLAKDPSMNGAQLGKVICDSALKSYDAVSKRTHTFSVIDLTKMPELREAYEAYFDEAVTRANEETGFSGAFARAAENRNVDKYSNWYADLGLLAKNTKSIMPDASDKLLKAIDKAVVYNKRGAYLKSRGISTYTVPILCNGAERDLIVRYDTSTKKYEMIGFGSMIENGMVRGLGGSPTPGSIITPIYWTIEDNDSLENVILRKDSETGEIKPEMWKYTDPQNGSFFIKAKIGEPFVYTRDSAITNSPIRKGNYFYHFLFNAPNGDNACSYPGVIAVDNGKIFRFTTEEFAEALAKTATEADK